MTTGPSAEFVSESLKLSQEFLDDCEALFEQGRLRSSVDRAYYAIHHAAIAMLADQGIEPPKSHSGLINLFGSNIVKAGIADSETSRILSLSLRRRIVSTYSQGLDVSAEEAESAVRDARLFTSKVRSILDR